jgi:hypothetical protein
MLDPMPRPRASPAAVGGEMGKPHLLVPLVLGAALLGALLPRPGAGVGQAQAPVEVRCLGFEPGGHRKALVRLHNAGPAATLAQLEWLRPDGGVMEAVTVEVGPGQTVDDARREGDIGVVARISTPGPRLLVDAEMVYDDDADEQHRRTILCTRVP